MVAVGAATDIMAGNQALLIRRPLNVQAQQTEERIHYGPQSVGY
jgi:hypothetical protein